MKSTIAALMFMLIPISASATLPAELENCSTEFSFGDLGYYEKAELVEAYCRCVAQAAIYEKLAKSSQNLGNAYLNADGATSTRYLEWQKDFNKALTKMENSSNNTSKIARILKKDHQAEAPACAQGKPVTN